MRSLLVCLALTAVGNMGADAWADIKLPPAAKNTVYKCEVNGRSLYSDSPCMGAEKVDVTPTRGMNTMSGIKRVGSDVHNEMFQESLAEVVAPLTGHKTADELALYGRRMRLPKTVQAQCAQLDITLPAAEQSELRAKGTKELAQAQAHVFRLRKEYRELRCE